MFRKTRTVSAGSGRFHCPGCHEDREYELAVTIEQPAFLGVTLGTGKETARNVVCRACGTRFDPEILFSDAERFAHRVEAALRQGLRGLIVRMVVEDGRIAPEERAVVARVYEELLGSPLSEEELDAEIEAAEKDRRAAGEFANDMAAFLDPAEKATVLRAALRVAKADHDYDPSERHLLAEIGAGLEMAPESIRTVLGEGQDPGGERDELA